MKKEQEIKIPTVEEIQEQINRTLAVETANQGKLENLITERALIVCEGDARNNPKIDSLDHQIAALRNTLESTPAVLTELNKILTKRQKLDAERVRNGLISQHLEICDEVRVLSKNFVALLERAFGVNQNLIAALSVENGIAQKTGQQILDNFCRGSQDYLRVLLETMQRQISGIHTQPVGPGIVRAATELRI